MKIAFSKSIDDAPKGYLRVRLTQEERGTKRFVREGAIEWLELGVGKPEDMNQRRFVSLCRSIIRAAKEAKYKKVATQFDRTPELFKNLQHLSPEKISEIVGTNYEMANFEFTTFKTKPKDGWPEVTDMLACGRSYKSIEDAVRRGQEIGRAVNAARELANTPGGDMTPRLLAKAAKDSVKGLPVKVTTLGRSEMKKLGMGAILGVGQGSAHEPTFTVMEYRGARKAKPIVLAGKGITFDSGGLNLKTSDHIYEMHLDMSGAAAVIHAVALAARLKVKRNVIGLIPAAENMVGNDAIRPGDVLRSLSGKTIEVLNTDAEGRLVLADALTYAKRFEPTVAVDVATLTGACHIALGHYASGLFSRDDALADRMLELGESSGDYVWRLPLWDEYEASVKGVFADLSNIPADKSRYGGATNGAMFLWQFAKELGCPWAHIDIAPRMTSAPGDELAKGAAGAPVRLLFSFIEDFDG
ncbi:MAG: leucyl aminopeptidase [Candidatus Parcubacteria bacterium]|jgi:leucyl aminopeptidase|nr:leucyl aminopeptidase [Candidatus Parcubacteria bacterium]